MQGKQNVTNTERKGPHKSMHCKFCKPPGAVPSEKPSRAMLETKTKVHLIHEGADLRLSNVHDEPGYPIIESEGCICMLEGENACPKCVPDKSRPPPKKKVCKCPKGAKPDLSKYNQKAPEKKKKVNVNDEFWWEKYSREHDAMAKETWEAYMAQRQKDKKLEKCKKREWQNLTKDKSNNSPYWYQKLSCQQMIYVEHLSTAIRLDSDENITERTHFILGGIGLCPRPKKNVLKKCLRYCHYNAIQFLNQLHILIKDDDPYQEKLFKKTSSYTWNEKLIMNSLCYLEFPGLLREIMDRLPPIHKPSIRPQIPYPVIPKQIIKYDSPYKQPLWQDRINWVEKMKIDRLNRCRIYMETKRVKIPPLALVRRPSLIDARPPFLAQIMANERASRRLVKEEKKKPLRKHPISTFNSAVDVTAIAGIEASEISTTDKADTDDICVFLRDPKEPESIEGEMEEELILSKEVKFVEEPKLKECMKGFSECEECSEEGEKDLEDTMEFKTPPKTESGETIASPCPPPDATPGPPVTHFEKGKRELGIINKEICGFFPYVSSSAHIVKEEPYQAEDVELNLKSAAEKLKKLAHEDEDEEPKKKKKKKPKCKGKKKRKCRKRKKSKRVFTTPAPCEQPESNTVGEDEDSYLNDLTKNNEDDNDDDIDTTISFKKVEKYGKESDKRSQESDPDPDPDTEDEWSRPLCTSDVEKSEIKEKTKKTCKRKKGKCPRRKSRKKKHSKEKSKGKAVEKIKTNSTVKDDSKGDKKEIMDGQGYKEEEEEKVVEFRGDVAPLVEDIVKDLAEEGFYCATYPFITRHPDIYQLILHLKGAIMTKKLRKTLYAITKSKWAKDKGITKITVPELGISSKKIEQADWNDKKWISKLAKWKLNCFYYNVAKVRAGYAVKSYNMLFPEYFGSEKFIKQFYSYMPARYEDCILRGIF